MGARDTVTEEYTARLQACMDGTHAERIAVPAEQVYHIPDELDFQTAAAFPLVFETAFRMLATKAGLRENEWVLVWGIGSGVSTA